MQNLIWEETQAELKAEKPSLNSISFLSEQIQRNENLQKHYNLQDCYNRLSKIKSVKQLKFWHYALLNKKYNILNKLIIEIGFKKL